MQTSHQVLGLKAMVDGMVPLRTNGVRCPKPVSPQQDEDHHHSQRKGDAKTFHVWSFHKSICNSPVIASALCCRQKRDFSEAAFQLIQVSQREVEKLHRELPPMVPHHFRLWTCIGQALPGKQILSSKRVPGSGV